MNKISVLIFAHNEEEQIKDVIISAQTLTKSIYIADIKSTDKTDEIGKNLGSTLLNIPFVAYVELAREEAISQIDSEWILILDADERITSELAQEIKKIIVSATFTHFKIPRKEIFGKEIWLKHGGWWPNHQIRLFKKNNFISWPKVIHSTPQFTGKMGYLMSPILHFSKGDIEKTVIKTTVFEDIESDLLLKAGKNVSHLTFLRKFMGELYRRMFVHLGFLDGEVGIIESIYQAFSKTITYLYLYEKKTGSTL
ncbi:MAG: glycosyltransferase family 2 protein [bacterium]|nr:glycosyltransferase family 2 protein [bacterium]